MWSQLSFGVISGISAAELFIDSTGGAQSFGSDELSMEGTDPIIECKTCLLEFSASRIPKIFRNCGHTICEYCADVLLEQNSFPWIACPMCQTVTDVDGSASKLVTNLAVLKFVEGIKME